MSRAVLSIGSNVGDSLAHLQSVVDGLGDSVVAVSAVYSTAPWGGVEQQDFLNAVLVVDDSALDGYGWLRRGQELETAADRVRTERWGPRTLDVDVVTCGDVRSDDPDLILPHPRAHERAFVLIPWLDVDPDAVLPVDGASTRVDALLALLDEDERAGVHRTELVLNRRSR
ncbi:2-amino-4-hydroxy-6-hydroxymethyldihydropteridine diphosphokinase [Rhodococcus jostii]|uniref:2-amino-4-hydroxy-6-hydroxymethyldihydropteridine diphosphokinase n=1 Tax=Rhodococcus jostii TaxID=132919 RepID=A0A1H5B6T7_RHOJO|nr:2-amino-4-hydroxy-6-hydroxymethyldihydropteridine diphosphokinase [Rhodococcus jostii]SED50036.1 2-amino-4-hydroxy-6-hydroxymethyldihydropteridinediphosphokinase [Rhodococcus jostii]